MLVYHAEGIGRVKRRGASDSSSMSTSVQLSSLERDPHARTGLGWGESWCLPWSRCRALAPLKLGDRAGLQGTLPCAASRYPQAEESFEPISSPVQML